MNANETIFLLALASNTQPEQHLAWAIQALQQQGELTVSSVYQIPCRDGVGEDYLNCGCILRSGLTLQQLQVLIKTLEHAAGRVRPSHAISLDIDLIAWGTQLTDLSLNQRKMPFALDVKIPLFELVEHVEFRYDEAPNYPKVILQSALLEVI